MMMAYRILIVEDELIVGENIKVALESAHYAVEAVVGNGKEAICVAEQRRPDLILMDIHLDGELDGVQTAEIIKKALKIPVVYLTAFADPEILERAKLTDPYGYLVKPFQENNLLATVEIALYKHRLEQRLKDSEARYHAVVEQTADGILLVDLESSTVVEFNRAIQLMSGYSEAELIGKKIDDLFTPASDESDQNPSVGIKCGEKQLLHKQKFAKNVEISSSLITYNDRQVVCLVVRDITEREHLEKQVMATQKLASLGTLAAGVAHEINTPLQVIYLASQSIYDEITAAKNASPKIQENIEMIRRNAQRCAEISRALRTYAHGESQELTECDLNHLVKETDILIGQQMQKRQNIQIDMELDERQPKLLCDRNQIIQVLINLLNNARDAMPFGGQVIIRTGEDPKEKRVLLSVEDTGSGIPEDVLGKIFDPFFTTKSIGEGTGLGLSVVAGIVRSLHGEISVESKVNVGTKFTISLPE
jgi:PAS domain S-box-containing protein